MQKNLGYGREGGGNAPIKLHMDQKVKRENDLGKKNRSKKQHILESNGQLTRCHGKQRVGVAGLGGGGTGGGAGEEGGGGSLRKGGGAGVGILRSREMVKVRLTPKKMLSHRPIHSKRHTKNSPKALEQLQEHRNTLQRHRHNPTTKKNKKNKKKHTPTRPHTNKL